MQKMYWNERIATVAQKWARVCLWEHDTNTNRRVGYGLSVGQNGALGYGSWAGAIRGWYSEVRDFDYNGQNDWTLVGHFTQVESERSNAIGCGFARCNGSPRYWCNYAFHNHGYTEGESCSACPTHCENNLCDCGPILCQNGAALNLTTCTCGCPWNFYGDECENAVCGGKMCENGGTLDVESCVCSCVDVYYGETCELIDCSGEDSYLCGGQWPKDYCDRFTNVPGSCPFMCELCEAPCNGTTCSNGGTLNRETCTCSCTVYFEGDTCDQPVCNGMTCSNGGTLDAQNCTCACDTLYTGPTCDDMDCPNQDLWYCPGYWPPSYCSYSNVRTSCPIMCELCPPPCGGKECLNGGTLNTDTCECACTSGFSGDTCDIVLCDGMTCANGGSLDTGTCTCTCTSALYTGPTCEEMDCSGGDAWYCGSSWPESYCTKFTNVPETCPFMCGLCQADTR